MKKILISFIFVISVFFVFSATQASAACYWVKKETYYDTAKRETVVKGGCAAIQTEKSDSSCSGTKPKYDSSDGVARVAVCCCDKSEANTATAKDTCSWQISKSYYDTASRETVKTTCSTGTALYGDNNCSTPKPENKTSNGIAETPICCCKAGITAKSQTKDAPRFVMPEFQIKIPGLNKLSDVSCANGVCKIPWISEYTFAVYEYGLSIAGILGVLILMAAGLLWIVSGGDQNKITKAKKMIFGSIVGLIILVGANLLLTNINPDLAELKTINIGYVERIELEQDVDITVVGGVTGYLAGCKAAKNGDLSVCEAYGNAEPGGLINAPGKKGTIRIKADIYQKYQAAMECVRQKNNGQDLFVINEAFRSAAEQIRLKEQGYPAATPCCSNHSSGQAMDIHRKDGNKMTWEYNISSGLKECMNAQGLYANLNKSPYDEPWHWSPTGK